MANSLTKAATEVFDILAPLSSEERARVLNAVRALLGESSPEVKNSIRQGDSDVVDAVGGGEDFSPPVRTWMRKNGITAEQLENSFHVDGSAVKVISLIGSAKKKSDQTANTYLALGVANFLASGEASFADDEARALCQHFGCYDVANHSRNVKSLGNKVTGSKSSGWKLTAPGLAAAAEMIKA